VAVACQDEAGPYQTVPYPGTSWEPQAHPRRPAHEYLRLGTVKLLTLFRPATGQVRVKGVTRCPNTVLHAWLKSELDALLATLPEQIPLQDPLAQRAQRAQWTQWAQRAQWTQWAQRTQWTQWTQWTRWQEGLRVKLTLPAVLPPLRLLLGWDNLTGRHTPDLVLWLFARGVMVLYPPLSGSWLNMAESIQRILGRRALAGQHPQTTDQLTN
jgi:hypothetical protein